MPRKPADRGGRERRHRCCHGNTSGGGGGTAHGRRRHNTTASSLAPSVHPSTTTSGGPAVGSCGAPASIGNRLRRRRRGEERDGGKTLSPSLAQGASRAPRVAQCAPSSLAAQLPPPPAAAVEGRARTNDTGQLRTAAPPTHVSGLKKASPQNFTAREWLRAPNSSHVSSGRAISADKMCRDGALRLPHAAVVHHRAHRLSAAAFCRYASDEIIRGEGE